MQVGQRAGLEPREAEDAALDEVGEPLGGAALRPVVVEAGILLLYPLILGTIALWLIARAGRRA